MAYHLIWGNSEATARTFIIIDEKYIVLPILTYENQRQERHGALIFYDMHGDLFKCLDSIYQIIDARAIPLGPKDLQFPKENVPIQVG